MKSIDNYILDLSEIKTTNLWGLGRVFINNIPHSNFGAYFVPTIYNSSISSPKSKEKGKRLKFYPTSGRIYNCSGGIIKPEKTSMTFESALALVDENNLSYAKKKHIIKVIDEKEIEVNNIIYLQYKNDIGFNAKGKSGN